MIKAKMKQLVKDKLLLFAGILKEHGKRYNRDYCDDPVVDAVNDARYLILTDIGEMLAEFAEREL